MICEHLRPIEAVITASGVRETFRGQAWSNTGEWVYYDCCIDVARMRSVIAVPACVADHEHLGTHDGQERGFVCTACGTGLMGVHPAHRRGARSLP